MSQGNTSSLHLPQATFSAQLSRGLDQQKYTIHPRMCVRESSSIGVHRKCTTRSCGLFAHKGTPLARPTEAQCLQREEHSNRERIIDFSHINVGWSQSSHRECCLPGVYGRLMHRKIRHVQDRIMGMRFAMSQNP